MRICVIRANPCSYLKIYLLTDDACIIIEKFDDTGKEVAGEIREMREDLRSYLDRRLIRIEDDITKIKAKIDLS